ncbi:helicase ARIP4 isoform X1 [Corythoichthys intestinalis]|uniref:helicase ARIP4 isoform X1 n=1 Tax=Corythoichthys intestinalis TaxID=161448 RepID=UPI0025A513A8|nr:helicase ARIP4 isoform X1 [Corythoichthys intestinalis]
MSEEALSESDLEASLNSEEDYNENDEEEDDSDMEDGEEEDESSEDDEDDGMGKHSPDSTSATSGDPSSESPSRPESQPSSRAPSRPTSRSQLPSSSGKSRKSKKSSSKSKKQKDSKITKSSKPSKRPKPPKIVKPVHMRKNIRKVLNEDQLEAGTKAAQQEEMERRKRLEQQRKAMPAPTLLESQLVNATSILGGMSHLVPALHSKQDVICLDSSGDEDGDMEPKHPQLAIRDDIIELSSGDEDALQISSESGNEDDGGPPGTEESSGAHINDALNLPDAQGRVMVNINHPAEEKDIYLAPQLARAVKPHQIGGIRFLYDNLIESLERYKSSSGFGCILAHSMGLGKTLQVISFIDILLRNTEAHTVLAIVPVNTLQNWLAEFNLWLPPQETLSPDTDPALLIGRTFKVQILNDEQKTTIARAKVVEDWSRDGGVLLMGYEMYRLLSMKKSFVTGKKRKSKKPVGPVIIDLDEEDRQQELMKAIEKSILRPGPDVVICDEGHRIKNYHASTSQALKNIRSRRRVVLTGYPLQNNLIEYWCMVDFVRPDFLGTRQEFSNMFERPILNGQCMDSTPQDVRLMRYRSHVLHSLLEGFVQRRGHDVLQHQLPMKMEHVILVRLSPIQKALYTEFMNRFREAGNNGWLGLNPLKAFCVCCKIWNHPDVLYEALQKENQANEQDLDLDDIASGPKGKVSDSSNSKANNNISPLFNPSQERSNQVMTYEWANEIMSNYQTGLLENSGKMVLLFHLIDESVRRGDKMLVFSQSLTTLTVIEDFLSKRPIPLQDAAAESQNPNWVRNLNYYRLDGSTSASERERLINQFNDPENTKTFLFLLSTRAGCLGVNLIGANRVVVFDASWNPCHDAQAVCRVYRYGQKKPCYIYRLVCDFTLEKKIYDRQVSKQGMSDRVVDDLNPALNFTRKEVESLLHFVEEEPEDYKINLRTFEEQEPVLYKACQLYPRLITKQPFEHESLLVDRKESKLTKAEKRAAKKSYEDEKRASVPYSRPSYAPYYPASNHALANIPAFSQRGWRPMARPDDKPVASVRPIQSTPIPMMPRQVVMGMAGSSSPSSLPVNFLQKAGVYIQRIVTTTDIFIPGANSTTDVQARISAGESIHVIRGSKGTYIRTNDGRIFAIRSGKVSRPATGSAAVSRDSHRSLIHPISNGCASPGEQLQQSPDVAQRSSSPLGSEILRELSHYTASTSDGTVRAGNELSSPMDASGAGEGGRLIPELRAPLDDNLLSSGFETQGVKRKRTESQGPTARRTSATSHFTGLPMNSSGLSFPPVGLNSSTLLGGLGHMTHPLLIGASGGSSFLQTPGQTLTDIQAMFPSASGNGQHPPTSSSALSTVLSSSPNTIPMSSATSAPTTSSLASGSLTPYLMNPNVAGLLSSGFPLNYSQSLLPEPRMFPGPLLSGSAGFATPNSAAANASGFLTHFNNPTSSLLGAALTQPDRYQSAENRGDSSDDDVIEVTGH